MRVASLWVVILLSFVVLLAMVSQCGALGCSWETTKDARGLNRHRASCHLYKRHSVLATQKRREHAKEASRAVSDPTNQTPDFLTHCVDLYFRESAVPDQVPLPDC